MDTESLNKNIAPDEETSNVKEKSQLKEINKLDTNLLRPCHYSTKSKIS